MMLVLRQLSAYIASRGICTGKLTGQFYVLVARVCKIDISFLELNLNVAQTPPNLYVAEEI